ncbi:hypothetical protein B0H11DRAFT_2082899 [Mycena galericulata]|nr:hypothetical protein B0H11DRAFT_2082899 [Mycena galericulata]
MTDPLVQGKASATALIRDRVKSPVRRIPPEILAEIFKFCVKNSLLLGRDYSIDNPRVAPLVLSHVCSLWRAIAIKTPRLWDLLSLSRFPKVSSRKMAARFAERVRRSNRVPLTAVIRSDRYWYDEKHRSIFYEVEHLEIALISPLLDNFFVLPTPCFPRLRTLHIEVEAEDDWSPFFARILGFFSCSPILSEIAIRFDFDETMRVSGPREPFAPHFPWSQLTNLFITGIDLWDARGILRRCTILRNCVFMEVVSPSSSRSTGDIELPACTLPNLQRLVVLSRHDFRSQFSPFFKFFIFPNLRHLEFDVSSWGEDPLCPLSQRSHFALVSLSLHFISLNATMISAFLALNSTLEELRLRKFKDQGIIDVLQYRPGHPLLLLPRLRSISIETELDLTNGGKDLVRMLESRWNLSHRPPHAPSFSQLEKAELYISGRPLSTRAATMVQNLCSAGLHIHLSSDLPGYWDETKTFPAPHVFLQ